MNRELKMSVSDKVPESEFSIQYTQGMLDRMAMSYFKYGLVKEAYPTKVDAIASLEKRLALYKETGNTEWLMDIGNFAMIEYMHPKHSKAHFKSTDADESPGRVWNSGAETDNANTTSRENVRRGGSNVKTSGGFYKNEGD
jgi:hypothetical protein